MLRARIIPCLLIKDKGLVKTVQFDEAKYVGDPLNAVRIYNEKEVDELMVLDIDATVKDAEPDYQVISNLAAECRMPLCYGGGVRTLERFEKIVRLGVEKVAFSAAAIEDNYLIRAAAERIGSQSLVVVIDVKKTGILHRYEVVTHNGSRRTGLDPIDFAIRVAEAGVGEILVQSVDRDGKMKGYDFDLVDSIRRVINVPITVLGGAGSLDDIERLIKRYGIVGAAAGSIFVFKGKYRAVLINYPDRGEKERLCQRAGFSVE